jgi:hypothetical protein
MPVFPGRSDARGDFIHLAYDSRAVGHRFPVAMLTMRRSGSRAPRRSWWPTVKALMYCGASPSCESVRRGRLGFSPAVNRGFLPRPAPWRQLRQFLFEIPNLGHPHTENKPGVYLLSARPLLAFPDDHAIAIMSHPSFENFFPAAGSGISFHP